MIKGQKTLMNYSKKEFERLFKDSYPHMYRMAFSIPLTGKTLTVYSDGYETISDIQPSDTVLTIRMKPLVNTIKTKEKGAILIRGTKP